MTEHHDDQWVYKCLSTVNEAYDEYTEAIGSEQTEYKYFSGFLTYLRALLKLRLKAGRGNEPDGMTLLKFLNTYTAESLFDRLLFEQTTAMKLTSETAIEMTSETAIEMTFEIDMMEEEDLLALQLGIKLSSVILKKVLEAPERVNNKHVQYLEQKCGSDVVNIVTAVKCILLREECNDFGNGNGPLGRFLNFSLKDEDEKYPKAIRPLLLGFGTELHPSPVDVSSENNINQLAQSEALAINGNVSQILCLLTSLALQLDKVEFTRFLQIYLYDTLQSLNHETAIKIVLRCQVLLNLNVLGEKKDENLDLLTLATCIQLASRIGILFDNAHWHRAFVDMRTSSGRRDIVEALLGKEYLTLLFDCIRCWKGRSGIHTEELISYCGIISERAGVDLLFLYKLIDHKQGIVEESSVNDTMSKDIQVETKEMKTESIAVKKTPVDKVNLYETVRLCVNVWLELRAIPINFVEKPAIPQLNASDTDTLNASVYLPHHSLFSNLNKGEMKDIIQLVEEKCNALDLSKNQLSKKTLIVERVKEEIKLVELGKEVLDLEFQVFTQVRNWKFDQLMLLENPPETLLAVHDHICKGIGYEDETCELLVSKLAFKLQCETFTSTFFMPCEPSIPINLELSLAFTFALLETIIKQQKGNLITCLLIYSFTYLLIYSFTHLLIHSFTHLLVHSFTHSLIHSFTSSIH